MRLLRQLASNVWYNVDTEINNKEPLFGVQGNVDLFMQVLFEAYVLFAFELRGLKFNGAQVLFFIKPADGLKLPAVMQWIKQTFAVRFDQNHRRTGHIWGDRYGSEILPGEPPPDAEVCVFGVAGRCANRRARRAPR
jgi:hypothetical protein